MEGRRGWVRVCISTVAGVVLLLGLLGGGVVRAENGNLMSIDRGTNPVEEVQLGVELVRPVQSRDEFFTFTLPRGPATITIETTLVTREGGQSCDIDLFLKRGMKPSMYDADGLDITSDNPFVMEESNAEAGDYYLRYHVFYGDCHEIRFRIDTSLGCDCASPEGGVCNDAGTKCVCNANYMGDQCETRLAGTITEEKSRVAGKVDDSGWTYYSLVVPEHLRDIIFDFYQSNIDVDNEQVTRSKGSVDSRGVHSRGRIYPFKFFIREGDVPTLKEFDYVVEPTDAHHTLIVAALNPRRTYYVGIHTFESDVEYAVTANFRHLLDDECLNSCSYNGVCVRGECGCLPGFEGVYCGDYVGGLGLGQVARGLVNVDFWNRYYVDVNTMSNVLVTLTQIEEAESDCDLFIGLDHEPSFFSNDQNDISADTTNVVKIIAPGVSRIHIGIYGFQTCVYQLVVDVVGGCSCGANSHGSCIPGSVVCVCKEGWAGEDCRSPVVQLVSGVQDDVNYAMPGMWRFYSLSVPAGSGVTAAVREHMTEGLLHLYCNMRGPPSLSTFDDVENSKTDTHQIVHDGKMENEVIYFGVYADSHHSSNIPFSIVAWYAPLFT